MESTLSTLVSARDSFNKGTLEDKRRILKLIGSDPVLTDKKLGLKEHYWVKPIRENISALTEKPNSVRTSQQQIKNASNEAKYQSWCEWRESNSHLKFGKLAY